MNHTYFISKDHRGISARAISGKDLPKEIYETFSYAVGSFGFLVQLNESISAKEWTGRIIKAYKISPRIERVIQAINKAMPN